MTISTSRLLIAVATVSLCAYITGVWVARPALGLLVMAVAAATVFLFLGAIDTGLIRFRASKFGHLLHLRCQRHPSIRAYCGYEHDFLRHCRDRAAYREVIEFVALRHPSGRIYATEQPGRHSHVIALMSEYGDAGLANTSDQGFVTSRGRYVGRQEAWDLASLAGQIKQTTGSSGTLFSEDLFSGPLLSDWQLEEKAWQLIQQAHHCNRVVTIETVPTYPLTMGEHDMIAHVRKALPLIRWEMAEERKRQEQETAHG